MVTCNYRIIPAFTYIMCICVETATEEAVYKVIAEPQEQPEQGPEEIRKNPA